MCAAVWTSHGNRSTSLHPYPHPHSYSRGSHSSIRSPDYSFRSTFQLKTMTMAAGHTTLTWRRTSDIGNGYGYGFGHGHSPANKQTADAPTPNLSVSTMAAGRTLRGSAGSEYFCGPGWVSSSTFRHGSTLTGRQICGWSTVRVPGLGWLWPRYIIQALGQLSHPHPRGRLSRISARLAIDRWRSRLSRLLEICM